MALTATIALSPSTVQINQKVTATVTITSTGAATTITGLAPYALYTGSSAPYAPAVAYGQPNLQSSNTQTAIAASGTSVIPFDLTFFAPSTGLLSTGSGTYDVGCQITALDGSVFHPTVATVTVNNITFASTQQ